MVFIFKHRNSVQMGHNIIIYNKLYRFFLLIFLNAIPTSLVTHTAICVPIPSNLDDPVYTIRILLYYTMPRRRYITRYYYIYIYIYYVHNIYIHIIIHQPRCVRAKLNNTSHMRIISSLVLGRLHSAGVSRSHARTHTYVQGGTYA